MEFCGELGYPPRLRLLEGLQSNVREYQGKGCDFGTTRSASIGDRGRESKGDEEAVGVGDKVEGVGQLQGLDRPR